MKLRMPVTIQLMFLGCTQTLQVLIPQKNKKLNLLRQLLTNALHVPIAMANVPCVTVPAELTGFLFMSNARLVMALGNALCAMAREFGSQEQKMYPLALVLARQTTVLPIVKRKFEKLLLGAIVQLVMVQDMSLPDAVQLLMVAQKQRNIAPYVKVLTINIIIIPVLYVMAIKK